MVFAVRQAFVAVVARCAVENAGKSERPRIAGPSPVGSGVVPKRNDQ